MYGFNLKKLILRKEESIQLRKKVKTQRASSVKAKYRASLSFRMNVLFFSIFVLFSMLIFRLGYLQIVKGEDYVRALERTEEVAVNTSVPRGRIYDRYGRVLVDNEPENAITYTKMQTTKMTDMLEIAEQLAMLMEQPIDRVTLRDKQDFWIMKNKDAAYEKVTEEEQKKLQENEELDDKAVQLEIDKLVRERISEEDLAQLTAFDLEVLAIYREMSSGYYLSPQIIKSENVTDEEFARVSERLSNLPGVNTTTDWKRVKLSSLAILGRTTIPSKGIPRSMLNYYLARDYSRNDRVGESYFEASYEELLQGQKSVVKNITNKQGQVIDTVTTYDGEPGSDLVTTIDIELQAEAERIVEQKLLELKSMSQSHLLDRAFFVMMDPNTGELLSVVGKKLETDKETGKRYVVDYSYGSFTTAYEVGSTVKAATLLMGYSEGAIEPGQVLIDQPIKLAGTNVKSSIFNRNGRIAMNDQMALERSSNSYMFQTAIRIAGSNYSYNMPFRIKEGTLQTMRNGYAQFGLGVNTGIDLPNEFSGFAGELTDNGKILNLAIGQFDTYTPLQMVQYISTVANGGYRIQPRMLKEVRQPSEDGEVLGPVIEEVTPKILNRISNPTNEVDNVKEGLRRVYAGANGSARSYFGDAPYTAAGKTGTAEVVYYGPLRENWATETINIAHVGFAPYENPEIAYAVIFPWATTNYNISLPHASQTAREIVDVYFDLKKKYAEEGRTSSSVKQEILPATTGEKIDEDTEEETVTE